MFVGTLYSFNSLHVLIFHPSQPFAMCNVLDRPSRQPRGKFPLWHDS